MDQKVCVARISETIATTDFKLQGVNLPTWVFLVCVACNFETNGTTDLELQEYIVQGVNLCTWVFSSIHF